MKDTFWPSSEGRSKSHAYQQEVTKFLSTEYIKQIDVESLKKRETNSLSGSCIGYKIEEKSYSINDLVENEDYQSKIFFLAKHHSSNGNQIIPSEGIQFTTEG